MRLTQNAKDDIVALQDFHDVGWLRVDLRPIKQVLTTYASKWVWTFTKYLCDQVTRMLENLDQFLKRTEPAIEEITGEERDTASFKRMMCLFNEVSAQQQEMDSKFTAMHRTVLLVKKYGQKLPPSTQGLFDAAPARWNSLKTKVSLAKQRLGPRIQEESESISKDLATFGDRVMVLDQELANSSVYSREFPIAEAWSTIDTFVQRLDVLENEAQDLIELQELLEANVVNFGLLPQCRLDLSNLKQVWETVRLIEEQQSQWRKHRWQKMNTAFLKEETTKQVEIVRALPEDVCTWDVYLGLMESITTIQACLPLIDDLSNPAMHTRHWKQLVRVTGGAVQIDNDTLKRMTLGELLSLGLQKHGDDVRAIVQRAVKDLSIEHSLKTYEEVWLSKLFELKDHETGPLSLLKNTAPIFDELESHQVALQTMQTSSAAGSFLDEVMKWQKRLQTVEAVLSMWLQVQEKWLQIEEVWLHDELKQALPTDSNLFAQINRDFHLLMRATERNPNVLMCCQRKSSFTLHSDVLLIN
ncbi:hypothetical protein CAPTEDRAFT_107783 [Capitella teleta]|uniref:Dynein heavy chain linker domain-containing protein n=1 Tax=Capitella teleta TaxID=283909 RepID=R7U726_CAPTE|nr:hypothetical protein CAPTEDRAFT_107783 [Capitella teleta]|eukprot:ELU01784.1 hypothetical protein CAPTEDRAFT_107783 [Capitella teleta]